MLFYVNQQLRMQNTLKKFCVWICHGSHHIFCLQIKRTTLVDSRTSVTDVKFAPKHMGLMLTTCSADGVVRIYEAPDVMNLSQWSLQHEISCKLSCSCISWNPSRFGHLHLYIHTDTRTHARTHKHVQICININAVMYIRDAEWISNMLVINVLTKDRGANIGSENFFALMLNLVRALS